MGREAIQAWLLGSGIHPTKQRLAVAALFHGRCVHLSAEEVFGLLRKVGEPVSKATVYNTLSLFVERGLVRQVIADPTRVFYDSNTAPHHHFFDVESGGLTDIDSAEVQVSGLPALPQGTRLDGVDVVIRIRPKS